MLNKTIIYGIFFGFTLSQGRTSNDARGRSKCPPREEEKGQKI
jgi:hypothetical protein